MFHDRARIQVQAGRGGDGGLSFRREKFVPKGGPDGGDGGRGGDVVLVADADYRDLSALRSKRVFRAARGEPGRGSGKHGADGVDVEIRLPVGTQVLEDDGLVADLVAPGARVVVARGGSGGRGNRAFATASAPDPALCGDGPPGRDRRARSAPEAASPTPRSSACRTPESPRCCGGSRMRSRRWRTIPSPPFSLCSARSTRRTAGS